MPFILAARGWAALWLAEAVNTHSTRLCSVLYQCREFSEWYQGGKGRFHPGVMVRTAAVQCPHCELYRLGHSCPQLCSPFVFTWSQKGFSPPTAIPKGLTEAEAPDAELERTILSLQLCPGCGKHTLFLVPSERGQLQKGKQLSTDSVDLVCPLAAGKENIWLLWIHKTQHETAEYKCCREKLRGRAQDASRRHSIEKVWISYPRKPAWERHPPRWGKKPYRCTYGIYWGFFLHGVFFFI